MNVIDSMWFNGASGSAGLVIGENELTKERIAYIAPVSGLDEDIDTQHVLNWGCPIELSRLKEVVAQLEKKEA